MRFRCFLGHKWKWFNYGVGQIAECDRKGCDKTAYAQDIESARETRIAILTIILIVAAAYLFSDEFNSLVRVEKRGREPESGVYIDAVKPHPSLVECPAPRVTNSNLQER